MRTLSLLILLSMTFPLVGGTVSDEFTSLDKNRWIVIGRCSVGSGKGVFLGPDDGMWAIDGLKTVASVGNPRKKIKVTAEFSDFRVEKDAPREGSNAQAPADMSANVELSGDSKELFFQTGRPSVLALLMVNREKNELWCGVRSKSSGATQSYGENLANTRLGPAKDAKVRVVLESAGGYSVTVTFFLNDVPAWSWSGSVPDPLGEQAYLGIYQQNILTGRGSVRLDKVSVETSE